MATATNNTGAEQAYILQMMALIITIKNGNK